MTDGPDGKPKAPISGEDVWTPLRSMEEFLDMTQAGRFVYDEDGRPRGCLENAVLWLSMDPGCGIRIWLDESTGRPTLAGSMPWIEVPHSHDVLPPDIFFGRKWLEEQGIKVSQRVFRRALLAVARSNPMTGAPIFSARGAVDDPNVPDYGPRKPQHQGAALADLANLDPPPSALAVPPPAPGMDAPFELWLARQPKNDVGNAVRLIARHGHDLIWVREIGWLAWDGRRWSINQGETLAAVAAQETYRAMTNEAKALEAAGKLLGETDDQFADRISSAWEWAIGCGNSRRLIAMREQATIRLARAADKLDANTFLFNCANGTLELGAREPDGTVATRFRPHARADLITRLSPVAYDEEATD